MSTFNHVIQLEEGEVSEEDSVKIEDDVEDGEIQESEERDSANYVDVGHVMSNCVSRKPEDLGMRKSDMCSI